MNTMRFWAVTTAFPRSPTHSDISPTPPMLPAVAQHSKYPISTLSAYSGNRTLFISNSLMSHHIYSSCSLSATSRGPSCPLFRSIAIFGQCCDSSTFQSKYIAEKMQLDSNCEEAITQPQSRSGNSCSNSILTSTNPIPIPTMPNIERNNGDCIPSMSDTVYHRFPLGKLSSVAQMV